MTTFADALATLLALYPKFDLTPEQAEAWRCALSDVSADALCGAAVQLARESAYTPSLHEWHARALTVCGRGAAHAMTAADAWDEMRRHRVRFSPTRYNPQPYRPQWSSEAVRRASEAVDWTNADWESEQIPTIRAQFERYFNAIKGQQETIDSSNAALSLMPDVLKSIGRGEGPRRLMGGDA